MNRQADKIDEKELNPAEQIALFMEASETENGEREIVRLAKTIKAESGVVEAAHVLRQLLIADGYVYDDKVFTLDEIVSKKRGNCLGLALFMGSILREAGFEVGYELINHPKDAVYEYDLKLFEQLQSGEHFDYDHPTLPTRKDIPSAPMYRFVPLEHPILVLGAERFETTGLEDNGESPMWTPDAEAVTTASFKDIVSHVYIDRAKKLLNEHSSPDFQQIRELTDRALQLSFDNREAWHFLWQVAREQKDEKTMAQAKARYLASQGTDSRYFFNLYLMGESDDNLDKALAAFPAHIPAFIVKHIELESDPRERKFNIAVAAWCIANSVVLDLHKFYISHKDIIIASYGEEYWSTLMADFEHRNYGDDWLSTRPVANEDTEKPVSEGDSIGID